MENFEEYINETLYLTEGKLGPEFKDKEAKIAFNSGYAKYLSGKLVGKEVKKWKDSRDWYGRKTGGRSGRRYFITEVTTDTGGNLILVLEDATKAIIKEFATTFFLGGRENGEKYTLEFANQLDFSILQAWIEAYIEEAKIANSNLRRDINRDTRNTAIASLISAYKKDEQVKAWLHDNVENITFKLPHSESGVASEFVSDKDIEKCEYEYNELISTIKDLRDGDIIFREIDDATETTRPDLIFAIADVKFKDLIENAPDYIKKFLADCKIASLSRNKNDSYEEHSKIISSLYVGRVIAGLFDDTIHFMDTPLPKHDLDQDFPDVNAYGEKVESLKEGKEDTFTCCICGEECHGYGNNPEPFKQEGRCCDACNLHYVIPARMAQIGNNEKK